MVNVEQLIIEIREIAIFNQCQILRPEYSNEKSFITNTLDSNFNFQKEESLIAIKFLKNYNNDIKSQYWTFFAQRYINLFFIPDEFRTQELELFIKLKQ